MGNTTSSSRWRCSTALAEEWPLRAACVPPHERIDWSGYGVLNEKECKARTAVLLDHYSGTVEMEALCMVDMIKQHVIPAVVNAEA